MCNGYIYHGGTHTTGYGTVLENEVRALSQFNCNGALLVSNNVCEEVYRTGSHQTFCTAGEASHAYNYANGWAEGWNNSTHFSSVPMWGWANFNGSIH